MQCTAPNEPGSRERLVTRPSAGRFVLLVSLFLVVFGNFALWRSLLSSLGGFSIEQVPFLISVFLVLLLVFFVIIAPNGLIGLFNDFFRRRKPEADEARRAVVKPS